MLGNSQELYLMGKLIDISSFIFQNRCFCSMFRFLIKNNLDKHYIPETLIQIILTDKLLCAQLGALKGTILVYDKIYYSEEFIVYGPNALNNRK